MRAGQTGGLIGALAAMAKVGKVAKMAGKASMADAKERGFAPIHAEGYHPDDWYRIGGKGKRRNRAR